jgi:hypothetical protein
MLVKCSFGGRRAVRCGSLSGGGGDWGGGLGAAMVMGSELQG